MSGNITLAMEFDATTLAIVAGVAVAGMVVLFFGVKFWLVMTRPPAINDVPTPTLDRRNLAELQHMAGETSEEDEIEREALKDEEAPDDLKAVVAPDEAAKADGASTTTATTTT